MKQFLILICTVASLTTLMAQAPEVVIKKGKATLDEAYYYAERQTQRGAQQGQ